MKMKQLKAMYDNTQNRNEFNKGRNDYKLKKGLLSSNGSYLAGWHYQHELTKQQRIK